MPKLVEFLNDAALNRYAGPRSFQRGADYYRHGHVESVHPVADGCRAAVRGQRTYRVIFSLIRGALDHGCDCPRGLEGAFCKHCVAAALAWRNSAEPLPASKPLTLKDAGKALTAMRSADIVKLLLEWAKEDGGLKQRLLQLAADARSPAVRSARALNSLRDTSGDHFAAASAIEQIEELLNEGHAALVVDLCESALRILAEHETEEFDEWAEGEDDDHWEEDEWGERDWYSGGPIDFDNARSMLCVLHLRACREAAIDPVALAQRLYELEFDEDIDDFSETPEVYGELLGPAGWIAFRKLAEEGRHRTHRHTRDLIQSIARATGDTDWLIRVLSVDLSSAEKFLAVIEHLRRADRKEEVLVWMDRAVGAFPKDRTLRAVALEEYRRQGKHDKVLQLAWLTYAANPDVKAYMELRRHAGQGDDWPEWRDNAIGLIRKRLAAAKGSQKADHSILVELFLSENNAEAAWREANTGGCSDYFWLRLAELREADHPGDVAPVLLRMAEREILNPQGSSYAPAVSLLKRAAKAMDRIGASAQFAHDLAALRLKYKARRNFIKLLDSL